MTTRVTRESVQVGTQQDAGAAVTRVSVQVGAQGDPGVAVTRMSVQVATQLAPLSFAPWNVFPIKP